MLPILALVLVAVMMKPIIEMFLDRFMDQREILWPEHASSASQAFQFHCDLWYKIHTMNDDPFVSDADWQKLLPICQYADEWYARTHPNQKGFVHRADVVRKLMG